MQKNALFILGSSSPRRVDILKNAGYSIDKVIAADIDEAIQEKELPLAYVKRMSYTKCEFLQPKYINDNILCADTIIAVGRRILGKPKDADEAGSFLKLLSGRSHRVYTSVTLWNSILNKFQNKVCESRVKFNHIGDDDFKKFILSKQWQDKSGGYAIQGFASCFVSKIIGSHSNIIGLPIFEVHNLLKSAKIYPNWEQN